MVDPLGMRYYNYRQSTTYATPDLRNFKVSKKLK